MALQYIKDFYGNIIGVVEELPNGDKLVRDFNSRLLGSYNKTTNVTRDFYGRIIATGDNSLLLLNNKK